MSSYSYLQQPRATSPRVQDDISLLSRTSASPPQFSRSETEAKHARVRKNSDAYLNVPVPSVLGWPNRPQTLRKTTGEICLAVTIEIFLVLISLPLLALAIAVVYYRDKVVVEEEWRVFRQIINSVGTAFPYVFGLVVGRAMKLFAAWRLEHGVSLGVLEQIMGSSTLGGTLTTHSLLRPFNWPTLGLFTLWIFSPIGSRVSLGLIEPKYQPVVANTTIKYLDTLQQSSFYSDDPDDIVEVISGPINSVYSASLMTPDLIKTSSMDQWGNVKIPYHSRLDGNLTANATGWKSIPKSSTIDYTSLLGVPISKNSHEANTSWTMTTTYLELDCFNITRSPKIPLNTDVDGTTWHTIKVEQQTSFYVSVNGFISPNSSLESSHSVSAFTNATNSSSIPHTLLFQSEIWTTNSSLTNNTMATAYCDLSQAYVDTEILCENAKECRVTAMRESTAPYAPENFTVFGFDFGFKMISYQLPLATGENAAAGGMLPQSTAAELFISGITSAPSSRLSRVDLSLVLKKDMEIRLGQVLNTYYLASLAPYGLTGNLSAGATSVVTTPAEETVWVNRYYVSNKWLAFYFISCFVLLTAMVCGIVLKAIVVAPDILGFMSSLTRDNPHVRIPSGGTAMSGMERSRLLKGVRVKLGDVGGGKDGVGYIAVASEQNSRRLRKDELYS